MIERLKEALAECEAEKATIESRDDEVAIREEVARYEAEVRSTYAEKKAADLVEVSYQVKALNSLIAKEEARIAAEAAAAANEEAESAFQSAEVAETAE